MIRPDLVPEPVLQCLRRLEAAGHEAWLVGGALRNLCSGRPSADWDVATAATPEQTLLVFGAETAVQIGRRHGTIRVIIEGLGVDVTTFRLDGYYADGRRPEQVTYTSSVREDLSRRDFTLNAMAWHPERGLFDPFGGAADLRQGILRAVGEPSARLGEDALRIMRGLRFAAVFGYALDPALLAAMTQHAPLLRRLPQERLGSEWSALLFGDGAASVVAGHFSILRFALPESGQARPFQAWRALFKLADGTIARHIAFALAMDLDAAWFASLVLDPKDRRDAKAVFQLFRSESLTDLPERPVWLWHAAVLGADLVALYFAVRIALTGEDEALRAFVSDLARWRAETPAAVADLAVDGHDLLALGVPPPKIGDAIKRLFFEVAAGARANKKETLLAAAKLWYNC